MMITLITMTIGGNDDNEIGDDDMVDTGRLSSGHDDYWMVI